MFISDQSQFKKQRNKAMCEDGGERFESMLENTHQLINTPEIKEKLEDAMARGRTKILLSLMEDYPEIVKSTEFSDAFLEAIAFNRTKIYKLVTELYPEIIESDTVIDGLGGAILGDNTEIYKLAFCANPRLLANPEIFDKLKHSGQPIFIKINKVIQDSQITNEKIRSLREIILDDIGSDLKQFLKKKILEVEQNKEIHDELTEGIDQFEHILNLMIKKIKSMIRNETNISKIINLVNILDNYYYIISKLDNPDAVKDNEEIQVCSGLSRAPIYEYFEGTPINILTGFCLGNEVNDDTLTALRIELGRSLQELFEAIHPAYSYTEDSESDVEDSLINTDSIDSKTDVDVVNSLIYANTINSLSNADFLTDPDTMNTLISADTAISLTKIVSVVPRKPEELGEASAIRIFRHYEALSTPKFSTAVGTPALFAAPNTPALLTAPSTPALLTAPSTPVLLTAPNTPTLLTAPNTPIST